MSSDTLDPPVVSVIVPAHNAERTLVRVFECLVAQTLPCWEAVVVDDGSSDRTGEIARLWAKRDPRVHLMTQARSGVSNARNTGCSRASGPWIAFLDADDWWDPAFLEEMLSAIASKRTADIAYCGYQRVAEDGRTIAAQGSPHIARDPMAAFSANCPSIINSFLIRTKLVKSVRGFDESMATCEDWDFWVRVAKTGAKFIYVPQMLAFYRTTRKSLSEDLEAMSNDARRVIARAAAASENELSGGEHVWIACFDIWCVALGAARDQDLLRLIDRTAEIPDLKDQCHVVADYVADGFCVGVLQGDRAVEDAWQKASQVLGMLFDRLEAASSRPGFARRLGFAVEARILDRIDLDEPVVLTSAMTAATDADEPTGSLAIPKGVTTLHFRVQRDGQRIKEFRLPVFGSLSALAQRDLVDAAIDTPTGEPAKRKRTQSEDAGGAGNDAILVSLLASHRQRGARTAAAQMEIMALSADGPRRTPLANPDALEVSADNRRENWDKWFETEDPWDYGNAYEQEKYERTLSCLAADTISKAMELGCAEGHFTEKLAGRVGNLLAVDISARAIARARKRCSAHGNVSFRCLDFFDNALPDGFELIVCSEVLYYLRSKEELAALSRRLREALAPGGRLVMAHAFVLSDEPTATGFDWSEAFGAKTIHQTFRESSGLEPERAVVTDLYRIDVLRKTPEEETGLAASVEIREDVTTPPAEVEAMIVRGGVQALSLERSPYCRANYVPALMYHRVGDDGPDELAPYRISAAQFDAQLRYLKAHDFYTIGAADLAEARSAGHPPPGRPVVLTFDDGYQDFGETAWPLLQKYGFTADVFIAVDKVGSTADWDADFGPPAKLMTWSEIAQLNAQGVRFGSHFASHSALDGLTSEEVLAEGAYSRALIAKILDTNVVAAALPFGISNEPVDRIIKECGYEICFRSDGGATYVRETGIGASRIPVYGNADLTIFTTNLFERPSTNRRRRENKGGDPSSPASPLHRLASYLMAGGAIASAANIQARALRLDPKFPPAYRQQSQILLRSGAKAEALAAIRRALKLDPADAKSLHHLGVVHQKLGDINAAKDAWLSATEEEPAFAAPYQALSKIELRSGNLEAAHRAATTALNLDPKSKAARELFERVKARMVKTPSH